ncbi:hypothetical protein L6164_031586 [Bauhinia variegata]|uniref:Uncharacterized protein n=1 Tax=Bauhinia variegata TaxID=167791 RepID=A0ACB9LFX0_BAUVA|nr:hypothetical protein L6164_031586 [Bauhinia variegata]
MENQTGQPQLPSSTTSNVVASDQPSSKAKMWSKFKTCAHRFLMIEKNDWLEDMRGNLSMVAGLIASITFQAALNPPGGVVQTSTGTENTPMGCNPQFGESPYTEICTGAAVFSVSHTEMYHYFIIFNTLSFIGSLSAALLLVSGIPLRHRFPMWFLSFSMSASLTCLAVTYNIGLYLLIPPTTVVDGKRVITTFFTPAPIFILIWVGLLWLISLYNTIRFLVWLVEICRRGRKKKRSTAANPQINVL